MGKTTNRICFLVAALGCCVSTVSFAQAEQSDAAAQANNPLANLTAFNVQSYYMGRLTKTNDAGNQFWLRYAKPFQVNDGSWLLRASLPYNSFPNQVNNRTDQGLGDLNAFASYLFDTGNPAVSVGLGPQLSVPTASDDTLGSQKWSAGLAHVLFNASSAKFQYGYLTTWQTSFAGKGSRAHVNVAAFQPFAFYQLGEGRYLRAAPIWAYSFANDNYSIPVGIGIGQVVKQGETVYNFFVEPQISVADRGAMQPQWQVYFALNMQFY